MTCNLSVTSHWNKLITAGKPVGCYSLNSVSRLFTILKAVLLHDYFCRVPRIGAYFFLDWLYWYFMYYSYHNIRRKTVFFTNA